LTVCLNNGLASAARRGEVTIAVIQNEHPIRAAGRGRKLARATRNTVFDPAHNASAHKRFGGTLLTARSAATRAQFLDRYRLPILLVVVALFATAHLFRSPRSASDLEITPDSVEYAIGAQRLVRQGQFDIEINHVRYPIRYPFWFPVLALAPVYALAPGQIGNGIVVVFAFALAATLTVFLLARQLSHSNGSAGDDWGGVFAVLLLLQLREFVTNARLIMSDVPVVALGLLGSLLYLRMYRERALYNNVALRDCLLAGLTVALACGFRPLSILLVLPFVALLASMARAPARWAVATSQQGRTLAVGLLCLLMPILVVGAATGAYQQITFGDWKRSGYNYWSSLPYDFLDLCFSVNHVPSNLTSLRATQSLAAAALGIVGMVLLWRRARRAPEPLRIGAITPLRAALTYFALGVLPISLVHLFFFYAHLRYHVLTMAFLCAIGGAGLATLVPSALRRGRAAWLLPPLVTAVALLVIPRQPIPATHRRERADQLARATPVDAVIVTHLDPVYLEPLVLRGTGRRIIPASREVEYATKVITPRKVPLPQPLSFALARISGDHYIPQLRRPGTRLVIPFTADEAPDQIAALVRAGVPVYVQSPESQPWTRAFTLQPVAGETALARVLVGARDGAQGHGTPVGGTKRATK
jgi:hypothetical protein